MVTLIGLGNPGAEYETTRHNVGFMVLDALVSAAKSRFRMAPGEYAVASLTLGGAAIRAIKPLTYMNNSGMAVARLLESTAMSASDILVIVDDIHLPLGAIRIRRGGSDGGHNGLRSIFQYLGTNEIARMRCGVGGSGLPPPGSSLAGYVLAPFDRQEEKERDALIARAADAARAVATDGLDAAIQQFNRTTY